MMDYIIAGLVIAAGIAAYKLWKAGKAITTKSVVDGVKEEVGEAAIAAKPAIIQAIMSYFFKKK